MYYERRVTLLFCTLIFAISVLGVRLYGLSKPETNESLQVLDGQYTSRMEVCERSGFVYDRNMYLLSHNIVGKTALVNPSVCEKPSEYSEILSHNAAALDKSKIFDRINEGIPFTVFLSQDADSCEIMSLDGVYVFDVYEENTGIAKHFLGYNNADAIGVCGLRKEYDELLNKRLYSKVSAVFESDAKNASLSPFRLDCQKYEDSDGIVTTLDKNLQSFCDSFSDRIPSGAIAISDAESGEILAMSSFPGYDADNIAEVLDSDKGELVNRALQSFAPGSAFKIIMAAAALEKDSLLWKLEYVCNGSIEIDGAVINCHKHDGHGVQSMQEAFANSCNTYFINLGMIIGLDSVAQTMKKLGLDEKLTADFLCENGNFFPDEYDTSLRYLANISFGQGDLCLSPLDMISVVSSVSTGYKTELSVIHSEYKQGVRVGRKSAKRERIFSHNTVEKMLLMMEKCVKDGTGKAAFAKGVKSGGKTATAQTGRFDRNGVEYVHKWFCGVCETEKGRISICILCDYSTENALSPAIVFKDICLYLDENLF